MSIQPVPSRGRELSISAMINERLFSYELAFPRVGVVAIGMWTLVASTMSSRRLAMALPTTSSDSPSE